MKESKDEVRIEEVVSEEREIIRDRKYNAYVENKTPKHNWFLNVVKAFVIGGIICVLGELLIHIAGDNGLGKEESAMYAVLGLMLLSIVLTGFNVYPKIAKFAGAGCVVPITGFANSVASSAIEFKKEGQVFGIGAKIFTIAGPVILYGVFSSWLLGLVYFLVK